MKHSFLSLFFFFGMVPLCAAMDDPKPEPKKDEVKPAEDPVKTAERIARNAQEAGKRLADKDPGKDTRTIQDEIVKDIDSLIKKAQDPPPPSDSSNPPPMGGMGENNQPKSKGGMGNDSKPMPSGGSSRRNRAQRKPRADSSQQTANNTPMPQPKSGKQPLGKSAFEPNFSPPKKLDRKGMQPRTDSYKDVWGHLPEKMRQEMDLYYREQFIPRYSELLKQYYSSIAERNRKNNE